MKVSSTDKICQKHFENFQNDININKKSYWTTNHLRTILINDYLGFIESNGKLQFYKITKIVSLCDTLHKCIRENKNWIDTKFENRDIIALEPVSHNTCIWNRWALQLGYTCGKNGNVFNPRGIQHITKATYLPT